MWREITEDDVLGVLSSQESVAYQYAGTQAGQDVLATVLPATVQFCRAYIADYPDNELAPGNTLPIRCIQPAMHLVRQELLTRLDMPVSDDRRADAKEARRFFEQVAAGKVTIEKPDGQGQTNRPSMETLAVNPRIATRQKLSGL